MKTGIRIAVASAVLTTALALTGASRAEAGVSFYGNFPVPFGSVSIGIGDPYFPVGSYVPVAYPVVYQPAYGYGFAYHNHWVPARYYGSRWVVCGQPWHGYGYRGYAYPHYNGYGAYGYSGGYYGHGNHGGHGGWDGGHGNHGDHGNHGGHGRRH